MLRSTADGSGTLFSERYKETFHSTNGAVTESRHVFLQASGVADRIIAGLPTRILEIGFGLGLNTLISADAAFSANTALEFHSLENDADVFKQAQTVRYDSFLECPQLAENLRDGLELACVSVDEKYTSTSIPDFETRSNSNASPATNVISLEHNISLHIHHCDAVQWCKTAVNSKIQPFDAVYLDAFSPDTNPECWTDEFFSAIKQLMAPHAKLSTYSAKGVVRRSLLSSGFEVSKLPGPPGKREMMVASLKSSA